MILILVNFTIEVGDRLSRESKLSVIYSSDLQRASETAEIIASKCGGVEVSNCYKIITQ
jgi:broad specificity phosphatase PhoE